MVVVQNTYNYNNYWNHSHLRLNAMATFYLVAHFIQVYLLPWWLLHNFITFSFKPNNRDDMKNSAKRMCGVVCILELNVTYLRMKYDMNSLPFSAGWPPTRINNMKHTSFLGAFFSLQRLNRSLLRLQLSTVIAVILSKGILYVSNQELKILHQSISNFSFVSKIALRTC